MALPDKVPQDFLFSCPQVDIVSWLFHVAGNFQTQVHAGKLSDSSPVLLSHSFSVCCQEEKKGRDDLGGVHSKEKV